MKHFPVRSPPLLVEAIGYGAGSREFVIPNLLRATVGTLDDNQAKGYRQKAKGVSPLYNEGN